MAFFDRLLVGRPRAPEAQHMGRTHGE